MFKPCQYCRTTRVPTPKREDGEHRCDRCQIMHLDALVDGIMIGLEAVISTFPEEQRNRAQVAMAEALAGVGDKAAAKG